MTDKTIDNKFLYTRVQNSNRGEPDTNKLKVSDLRLLLYSARHILTTNNTLGSLDNLVPTG